MAALMEKKRGINMATDMMKTVWPEWQLEEKPLGRGSYGVVYKAVRRDHNVESYAAIKVVSIPSHSAEVDSLRSEGLDENATKAYFQGIVDDFVGEIQMMESLKGTQNIVSVEDYKVVPKADAVGWDIYIRMELLTTFNAYICDKKMTEQEVIKLGCDICSALEICNKRNIIHRDIKPENIFVNDFGHFKLGDFGIARKLENATGGLSQKGTYNYMAPEVANSGEYDARVDTYSLGIVLYRLLNGNRVPFLENEAQQMSPAERKKAVERRLRGEALPAPSEATPEMANLILKACAFRPEDRFSSAAEMHQALKQLEAGVYMADDLDKTTAVRGVQSEMDATTAVRKANDKNQKQETAVGSFGKKKFNKAKFIAIAVASGVLALAIALTVLFFSSSAYSVSRYMKKDDYQKALKEYRRDVRGSFVQETLLKTLLKGSVDQVAADYDKGEISFAEAVDELTTLDDMKIKNADAKSKELATKYADKVKAAVSAGEMTDEEAMTELNLLEELGFEGVDTHRAEVRTAYADCISAKYYNGELEYGEVVDKLAALITEGCEEAEEIRSQIMIAYADNVVAQYQNGDLSYDTANSMLTGVVRDGCEEAEASRQQIMIDYAHDIAAQYENDDIPYNTAAAILTSVNNDGCSEARELLNQITAANAADEAMQKAEEYYQNGEYKNAIDEYVKIPEGNEHYEAAKEKLQEAYADYISSVVSEADRYNGRRDYQAAIRYVDVAYGVLPATVDTSELDAAREKSMTAYKAQVAADVAELTGDGKWDDAFTLIEDSIAFEDDAYFWELKTSTEVQYVASITATVQNHINAEDYVSAKRVAETAYTQYPNLDGLKELIKMIEAETPTYLLDVCKPYESYQFWNVTNGETVSVSGKKYTNGFRLGDDKYRKAYALFNLDGQFTSLSFLVGHIDGKTMGYGSFKIYCDGVLSKEFSVNADALPKKYTIDLTGVKQLKIAMVDQGADYVTYMFANVTVE